MSRAIAMKMAAIAGLGMMMAALTPAMRAQAGSARLAEVLAQMNTASRSFVDARADFRWDYYERVVKDTSTQQGAIYFERKGGGMTMGAVVEDPQSKAKAKVIDYEGGVLQMFDPGVDQITVLHAGANQAQYESFLTLGFGGSGSDLERAWKIADLGPETIDGVKTEKLDLTAKDAQASSMFTHITIWVDPARAVSLKQVFYAPSGDVRTAYYSNIRLNMKIDKGTFAIKKDSHTTVVNR
jgi:outer membrane lipoprotein-sorting protein